METINSYCGIACDSCPIHLATLEQDKVLQYSMRISIANQISAIYKKNLKPEDITDCDGCLADTGRIFSECRDCEVRKCASTKKIDNCAHCSNYACSILQNHFLQEPAAENRLEEIRMTYCY
jgi:hypothetical protein